MPLPYRPLWRLLAGWSRIPARLDSDLQAEIRGSFVTIITPPQSSSTTVHVCLRRPAASALQMKPLWPIYTLRMATASSKPPSIDMSLTSNGIPDEGRPNPASYNRSAHGVGRMPPVYSNQGSHQDYELASAHNGAQLHHTRESARNATSTHLTAQSSSSRLTVSQISAANRTCSSFAEATHPFSK